MISENDIDTAKTRLNCVLRSKREDQLISEDTYTLTASRQAHRKKASGVCGTCFWNYASSWLKACLNGVACPPY